MSRGRAACSRVKWASTGSTLMPRHPRSEKARVMECLSGSCAPTSIQNPSPTRLSARQSITSSKFWA